MTKRMDDTGIVVNDVEADTVRPNAIAEVLNRPLSQELLARDLTRLAYVAKDGTPRSIPSLRENYESSETTAGGNVGLIWKGRALRKKRA